MTKGQKTAAQKEKYSFGTLFFFHIQEKQSEEKQHAAVHKRDVQGSVVPVKGRFSFVNHMDAEKRERQGEHQPQASGKRNITGKQNVKQRKNTSDYPKKHRNVVRK